MPDNTLKSAAAMGKWRKTEAGRIRSIDVCHFDIVQGCQLQCIGCPNSTLQPQVKRISIEDFDLCLGNIDVKVIGLLRLFNFGEALLHRDLASLLEVARRQRWKALQIEISTNAQFCDWPSFTAAIATRILTRLVVSCDGDGTPEMYERLRPPSRWSRLIEFLTRASDLRNRLHPGMQLMTRTICTDPSAQKRWRNLLGPFGWEPEFRDWQNLPQSIRSKTEASISAASKPCLFQERHDLLYVAQDGTVVPCCVHPRAAALGNLRRQTFNEIMVGRARQELTSAMQTDRAGLAICGACAF